MPAEAGLRLKGKKMDRNEFVSTLRAALTGNVPAPVVEDNVRYYDSYISQEIASGKSEQEVLDSLGDPRLIARTIIDTRRQQTGYQEQMYDTQEEPERTRGFHAEFNQDGGMDLKYKRFNFNSWYGRLLIAVVILLVVALVFLIVGGILAWVLPIVVPVILIFWLLQIIFGRRR